MMLFLQQGGYAQAQPIQTEPPKLASCSASIFRQGPGAISSGEWVRNKRIPNHTPRPFLAAQKKKVNGVLKACFGFSTFGNKMGASTTILGKRFEDTNKLAGIQLEILGCEKLGKLDGIAYYRVVDVNFRLTTDLDQNTETYPVRLGRFKEKRIIRVAWSERFSSRITKFGQKKKPKKSRFGRGPFSFYCFADGEKTFARLKDAKAATKREKKRQRGNLKGKVNFKKFPSKGGCRGKPWMVMDYIPNSATAIRTSYDMCQTRIVQLGPR